MTIEIKTLKEFIKWKFQHMNRFADWCGVSNPTARRWVEHDPRRLISYYRQMAEHCDVPEDEMLQLIIDESVRLIEGKTHRASAGSQAAVDTATRQAGQAEERGAVEDAGGHQTLAE